MNEFASAQVTASDYYAATAAISWDASEPRQTFDEVVRRRVESQIRGYDRMFRTMLPDRLWGRERYWFRRARHVLRRCRWQKRRIAEFEADVREQRRRFVRDKRHPAGFRLERWEAQA